MPYNQRDTSVWTVTSSLEIENGGAQENQTHTIPEWCARLWSSSQINRFIKIKETDQYDSYDDNKKKIAKHNVLLL